MWEAKQIGINIFALHDLILHDISFGDCSLEYARSPIDIEIENVNYGQVYVKPLDMPRKPLSVVWCSKQTSKSNLFLWIQIGNRSNPFHFNSQHKLVMEGMDDRFSIFDSFRFSESIESSYGTTSICNIFEHIASMLTCRTTVHKTFSVSVHGHNFVYQAYLLIAPTGAFYPPRMGVG